MGDNARFEGIKLHSMSRYFGLVWRVSRTWSHPYNGAVVLDSEDTDVYVQAAFLSHQLMKRKHPLFSCEAMLPKEVANIFPVHNITGSGHTSGFYMVM